MPVKTRKQPRRLLMKLTIETEPEAESDLWIAEVMELSGVMLYGSTETDAVRKVEELARRVLAERLQHGETIPTNKKAS